MNKTAFILLCLLVSGCLGFNTPVLRNKGDILRAPEDTTWIRGRSLTDDDIVYLKRFRQASVVGLGGYGKSSNITDAGLKTLSELDLSFYVLQLGYNNYITDEGIKHISTIQSLRELLLRPNPKITDKSIEYLLETEKLRKLDIAGCPGITDKGLEMLAQKESLCQLFIGAAFFEPELQKRVAKTGLELNDPENAITIEGIISLAQSNRLKLLYIQTYRNDLLTEENIKRIQKAFSNSDCSIMILEYSDEIWDSRGRFDGKNWKQIHGETLTTYLIPH